jgi:hypothetical protein
LGGDAPPLWRGAHPRVKSARTRARIARVVLKTRRERSGGYANVLVARAALHGIASATIAVLVTMK